MIGGVGMKDYNCCVVVVGAGPAGMAAAISAKKNGAKKVIVIERENRMGGILRLTDLLIGREAI